jgi:hypothetical protein
MVTRKSQVLILCKTYPSPSSRYSETSCVAGVENRSSLVRLFPVPFRLIDDERKFKKWQLIEAVLEKSKDDHRGESHRIKIDTIQASAKPITTKNHWRTRRELISRIPIQHDFAEVEANRELRGETLALLRPGEIVSFDITPTDTPDWTEAEVDKLIQHQRQIGLFDAGDRRAIRRLRKLPFDFHYRYRCETSSGAVEYRHKIVDWEIGALFWRCQKLHGASWEAPFRDKFERALPLTDLIFLMGTIHRFPNQWLIVSLIYPPKQQAGLEPQLSLLDL